MRRLVVLAFACAAFAGSPGIETTRIHFFGGKEVGRWTGGALVGWDNPAPVIYAFDKRGERVANITIRTPADASEIVVYRAVRAPDGSFALAGKAYVPTGVAALIWRISADGTQQKVFPTAPYIATDIAVTPDGTLWAAGVQKQTVRMSFEDYAEEHDLIHRFTPEGRPAGSSIPWKSVQVKGRAHPADGCFLLAAPDRVAWYPRYATEYVEFSLDGKILGRYPTAPMGPGQNVAGAALCDGGGLFVGRETRGKEGAELWEVLVLDRSAGTWRVVGGSPRSRWGFVYGCESERLVTWSHEGEIGIKELDLWTPR